MAWLAVVGFFAAFAPVIANGHPWRYRVIGEGAAGARGEWTSPMVRFFSPTDWVLLVGVPVGLMVVLPRWRTLRFSRGWRMAGVVVVGLVVWGVMSAGWKPALETWPYRVEIAAGRAEGSFAPVPWSPMQRVEGAKLLAPGAVAPGVGESGKADGMFALGTDSMGADVLSQMIHACRLALGVGLVGTVIAFVIGVVMGALMGYFGGVVDLVLYRVTEIVMGVPVVVLLILAASVLPRDVMVLMAIIGCCTWPGIARLTRAEFLRLRGAGFVDAARAIGAPSWRIMWRHMLPSAATPAVVDSSFAVAAAVMVEATLSYLGLGPAEQASWGRLLAGSTGASGEFVWWLGVFPGAAVVLTALACNVIGERMRE